jgi:integrase
MGYSIAEWAEAYLDHALKSYGKKTYQEKVKAFREFFVSFDPKLKPEDVHPGSALEHFQNQAGGRSGNAANKDRKNLIAAWNWARRYMNGWPRDIENPFAETETQEEKAFPRYIPSEKDFYAIYDQAEVQDRIMLLSYLHTGARRSEIFRLKWEDVDFENGRIRLWTRKRKKGLEFDWITMTEELQANLKWWHENRTFPDAEHVFLCEDNTPFCAEYYGQPFKERRHWLRRECERAGVRPFGIHAIRHLSASKLDDGGYPLKVIQSLLRHKSANTTDKYLHRLRGMREALDKAFKRESRPALWQMHGRPKLRAVK